MFIGGIDPDGDSLAFSLQDIMMDSLNFHNYTIGFSGQNPLGPNWNVSLDPVSGIVDFNPTQLGVSDGGYLNYKVDQYRNGVLVGSNVIGRKIYVLGLPGNDVPYFNPATAVSGLDSVNPNHYRACIGQPFCFNISAQDNSSTETLNLSASHLLAGASFPAMGQFQSVTGIGNVGGQFCWTLNTPGRYRIPFRVYDSFCPYVGMTEEVVTIDVGFIGHQAGLITSSQSLHPCTGTGDTLDTGGGFATYTWSNGATTPLIVVNTPGLYQVSVTTAAGCSLWDSVTVVNQAQVDISGTILDHLSAPLINQRVWLIRHDSTLQSLALIDSAFTDASGLYQFCDVAEDTVYVKAAPSQAVYPNEMATYADTAIFFAAARSVLAAQFPATVNFSTRQGTNPGGIGFIGGLLTQGANKTTAPGDPVPGQMMLLYSTSLGHAVAHATTDANGYFGFYFLQPGDYKVIADKPGVDPYNVPGITLTAQQSFFDSLDFRLHTTYLELLLPVLGNADPRLGFAMRVSPNPISAESRIHLQLPEPCICSFTMSDLQGRALHTMALGLEAGAHDFPFPPKDLPLAAGTYFLKLKANDLVKVVRIQVLD